MARKPISVIIFLAVRLTRRVGTIPPQSISKVLSSAFLTDSTSVIILARPPDELPPQPRRGVTCPNRSPVKSIDTVLSLPARQLIGKVIKNMTEMIIKIIFFTNILPKILGFTL